MSQIPGTVVMDKQEIKDTETAKRYFDAGQQAEVDGDRLAAIEAYEAAFAADPDDVENCFHLAYNLDLVGEELFGWLVSV